MTFLSRWFGLRKAAVSRWSPFQPQKDSAIARFAGPQLFHIWYWCRMPVSAALGGRGVGATVGLGASVGAAGASVATGVLSAMVGVGVRVGAGVAEAIAVPAGTKTTCSGGSIAYLTCALSVSKRQF